MKQILISSCGKCKGVSFAEDGVQYFCPRKFMEVKLDEIHSDCPLQDALTREEAVKKITVELMCTGMDPNKANEIAKLIADMLGFKNEGGGG